VHYIQSTAEQCKDGKIKRGAFTENGKAVECKFFGYAGEGQDPTP